MTLCLGMTYTDLRLRSHEVVMALPRAKSIDGSVCSECFDSLKLVCIIRWPKSNYFHCWRCSSLCNKVARQQGDASVINLNELVLLLHKSADP